MIVLILLIAALILAILSAFGVPSRVPLLAIGVVCLSVAALISRGVFS